MADKKSPNGKKFSDKTAQEIMDEADQDKSVGSQMGAFSRLPAYSQIGWKSSLFWLAVLFGAAYFFWK